MIRFCCWGGWACVGVGGGAAGAEGGAAVAVGSSGGVVGRDHGRLLGRRDEFRVAVIGREPVGDDPGRRDARHHERDEHGHEPRRGAPNGVTLGQRQPRAALEAVLLSAAHGGAAVRALELGRRLDGRHASGAAAPQDGQ